MVKRNSEFSKKLGPNLKSPPPKKVWVWVQKEVTKISWSEMKKRLENLHFTEFTKSPFTVQNVTGNGCLGKSVKSKFRSGFFISPQEILGPFFSTHTPTFLGGELLN